MTTKTSSVGVPADVDALSPEPDVVTLSSGFVVRVEPLKTRGMFKLLKIVTRGAGPILFQMPLEYGTENFTGQLLAVLFMAIPEAEDEAVEFIQSIVTPVDFNVNARTADEKQKNAELLQRLSDELDNPEYEDTFQIIEKVIQNEAGDIGALGKRLGSILKVQTASLEAKN